MGKLNKGREKAITKFALKVQANFRAYLARQRVGKLKKLSRKLVPFLTEVGAGNPKDGKLKMPDGCLADRIGTLDVVQKKKTTLNEYVCDAEEAKWECFTVAIARKILRRLEQEEAV